MAVVKVVSIIVTIVILLIFSNDDAEILKRDADIWVEVYASMFEKMTLCDDTVMTLFGAVTKPIEGKYKNSLYTVNDNLVTFLICYITYILVQISLNCTSEIVFIIMIHIMLV